MGTEVIEFELRCPEHGVQTALAAAGLPRPTRCSRCFATAESWREVRRFRSPVAPPTAIGSEVWIG